MKPKSAKYLARAQAFCEAVDLAVAIRSAPPYKDPAIANLRGLAELENIFFTSWNEGSGEDVERFWQLVAERGLPFERKDIVRDALNRGRINNEMDYQAITDSIVIQQQMGKISAAEAERLDKMLGQFGERANRRRSR